MHSNIIDVLYQNKKYILGAVIVLGILFLHDEILYPQLTGFETLQLSSLRWLLLFIPVFATIGIVHTSIILRWVSFFFWVLFIPYAQYSFLEIRHVSELCRIPDGYFTQQCADITWQVLPSFIYGLIGLGIFILSLNKLTKQYAVLQRLVIIESVILYSAAASVFGIFSRMNSWEILTEPTKVIQSIQHISTEPFLVNVVMIWIF